MKSKCLLDKGKDKNRLGKVKEKISEGISKAVNLPKRVSSAGWPKGQLSAKQRTETVHVTKAVAGTSNDPSQADQNNFSQADSFLDSPFHSDDE